MSYLSESDKEPDVRKKANQMSDMLQLVVNIRNLFQRAMSSSHKTGEAGFAHVNL